MYINNGEQNLKLHPSSLLYYENKHRDEEALYIYLHFYILPSLFVYFLHTIPKSPFHKMPVTDLMV